MTQKSDPQLQVCGHLNQHAPTTLAGWNTQLNNFSFLQISGLQLATTIQYRNMYISLYFRAPMIIPFSCRSNLCVLKIRIVTRNRNFPYTNYQDLSGNSQLRTWHCYEVFSISSESSFLAIILSRSVKFAVLR